MFPSCEPKTFLNSDFPLSSLCINLPFSPPTDTGIEKLIEPLRSTIQGKAKANSVKQEFEKQDELKRSAMRAVAALLTIPESGKTRVVFGRNIHPCIISFAWENNIYTFLNFQSVK